MRLSAERFNMRQRAKDAERAARPNVHTDPATGKPLDNRGAAKPGCPCAQCDGKH